jgi:hypothetical protein
VITVRDNHEGFSCNQIEQATIAQQLRGMVATPSACDFQDLVRLNLFNSFTAIRVRAGTIKLTLVLFE